MPGTLAIPSPFLTLAAMLLLAWVLLWVGLVLIMARMLLRPERMTDGRAMFFVKRLSPEDLGLKFDEASFDVIDQQGGGKLKIAGWWIPAAQSSDRCILLVHGYGDAKVGAIAWAPLLHSLGFNILAIDLRAHGESAGRDCTAGYFERHDVSQVIDRIRAERPDLTREISLFGISLGAAVCAAVGAMRDDIHAVILESPYDEYRHAVAAHAQMIGAPGAVFVTPGYKLAQWLSGADFEAVKPVDLIAQMRCKVMVIGAGDDPLVGPESSARLERAIKSRTDASIYWNIPTVWHVEGMLGDFPAYRQRVAEFLGVGDTSDRAQALEWHA